MSHEQGHRTDLATIRARAGVTGHNVRYVLIFGILGVVAAFGIAYVAAMKLV